MFAATEVIYCGDNHRVLPKYVPDESVDLVYIDPPFNTGRTYELFWGEAAEQRAYEDRFGDPYLYLDWMAPRLEQIYRVLKPTGSFYIHCDPTAGHYLKVLLDRIFGYTRFISEIVWKRTTAHSSSKKYAPIHDTILYYSKSAIRTWNEPRIGYDNAYLNKYYRFDDGDGRLYWRADLCAAGVRKGRSGVPWKGIDPADKGMHWKFTVERLEELDAEGRIYWPKRGTMPQYKRYRDELKGKALGDIWDDIDRINPVGSERQGYPTQKPLRLLERIISASSNQGDIVLDAFCGCGTTLEAAAHLKRHWIGLDFSPTACQVMADRLEKRCGLVERRDFRVVDLPRKPEELRRMPHFEFQNWAVTALGGIPNRVKSADFGIDGRLYVAERSKPLSEDRNLFGQIGMEYFPIQVKQKDKVGRPDIDAFETAMLRDRRTRGYFISFDFTRDAFLEIGREKREQGLEIIPVTVDEILREEQLLYGDEPVEFSASALRRQAIQPPLLEQSGIPDMVPPASEEVGRKRRTRA